MALYLQHAILQRKKNWHGIVAGESSLLGYCFCYTEDGLISSIFKEGKRDI